MIMREYGAESNGKLPHLFIPSKTATLVPEFAVEDLPLSRTAALVPEFAVKDLPLGEHSDDDVLQLRAETAAVRKLMNMVWMIYDGHMIPGDECGLHFLTFDLNQEIDPTGDRTRVRRVRSNAVNPRPQRWSVIS